jgi:hypothetical protein
MIGPCWCLVPGICGPLLLRELSEADDHTNNLIVGAVIFNEGPTGPEQEAALILSWRHGADGRWRLANESCTRIAALVEYYDLDSCWHYIYVNRWGALTGWKCNDPAAGRTMAERGLAEHFPPGGLVSEDTGVVDLAALTRARAELDRL